MLTLSNVAKSFGGRTLFSEVSLQVNREDRLGLVGPNGAGKSTLFNLILRHESPDEGEVAFQRGITLGFLPQESAPAGEETVIELATAISPEFARLRKQVLAWDTAHPDAAEMEDDAHSRFTELNGHQVESRAKKILAGLSFREKDFDRPAREMSGGWVMRAHLARLLTQEPDLLMLDEPTNHLDLEALLWFQEYLKGYPGAVLMISHDREFLNQIVGGIVEIRRGNLYRWNGNYDHFLVQRAAHEEQQLAAHKNAQRKIDQLQEFADRFGAKASKAAQAQSKRKQIERIREEMADAPEAAEKTVAFRFPQPPRGGQRAIELEHVRFGYGANLVYEDLNFEAERGQRLVLVGPNGAGKSTLLKLLAGVLEPQGGTRELGHNVRAGYFSQYRAEVLDVTRTVLEEALDTPQRVTEQSVRNVLGSFLFRGDDVFKKISVLSGGEKSRLALVKLLLDPPNLLLMDEPTTHLDMPSIDALLVALQQFEGTLIFISHDVYFIRALAKHVLHVNAGRLTPYHGDYQYYLDKTKAANARAALTAGGAASASRPMRAESGVDRKEQKRLEAEQRQALARDRRERQQLVQRLEKEIHALETRVVELTAELEKPETYQTPGRPMQLNRDLATAQDDLEKRTADWEAAATRLADLEEQVKAT
jgi:ATP-binding cassette subfamily F protein 3